MDTTTSSSLSKKCDSKVMCAVVGDNKYCYLYTGCGGAIIIMVIEIGYRRRCCAQKLWPSTMQTLIHHVIPRRVLIQRIKVTCNVIDCYIPKSNQMTGNRNMRTAQEYLCRVVNGIANRKNHNYPNLSRTVRCSTIAL